VKSSPSPSPAASTAKGKGAASTTAADYFDSLEVGKPTTHTYTRSFTRRVMVVSLARAPATRRARRQVRRPPPLRSQHWQTDARGGPPRLRRDRLNNDVTRNCRVPSDRRRVISLSHSRVDGRA
jgi:hypothetical protein